LEIFAMSMIESLENRQLLAAHVTEIIPDNRGEVLIYLSEAVRGVSKSSVRMYTFGTDGVANTSDDVRLNTVVRFEPDRNRIVTRVIGNVAANTGYRIRIQANQVRATADGSQFDGEYKSDGTSGNGVGNGNYNARFRADKGAFPRVRLSTTAGIIDLSMQKDTAPLTVQNFYNYVNSGRYDNLFVNRSVPNFVVQLGAARVTGSGTSAGDLVAIQRDANVANEFHISNTRGTVALAKNSLGGSADFFFNLADNSFLDAVQPNNGGEFTVFALVSNSASQASVDAIAAKPIVALANEFDGVPAGNVQGGVTGAGLATVPVNSTTNLSTEVTQVEQGGASGTLVKAGLLPNRDLVIVRRAALLLKTASV
jgi:cyclophilin family peptidyl-prolyl cis-trans isomerase